MYKGIYAEKELIINKSIVIKGIDNPVLDGENKYEIITVRADHVTVEGLSFRNAGFSSLTEIAAVKLDNCKYAFIHANDMEVSCFGVYVQASAGCIIKRQCCTQQAKASSPAAMAFIAGRAIACRSFTTALAVSETAYISSL